MHPYAASQKLLNFTTLDWEEGFLLSGDPAASSEGLHHTLVSIFLLESAAIYFSASLLLHSLARDGEVYQQFCVRSIRFSAITIIDACMVLIHQIVVDPDTQAQFSLRLDGLLLMSINLLLFLCFP